MQSFRDFIEQIQENPEEIQELFVGSQRFPEPPTSIRAPNKKTAHKQIDRIWKKFLTEITRLGYVVPRGSQNDTITLHNIKFSPNDAGGRFKLDLPKTLVKKLNI